MWEFERTLACWQASNIFWWHSDWFAISVCQIVGLGCFPEWIRTVRHTLVSSPTSPAHTTTSSLYHLTHIGKRGERTLSWLLSSWPRTMSWTHHSTRMKQLLCKGDPPILPSEFRDSLTWETKRKFSAIWPGGLTRAAVLLPLTSPS